MSDGRRDVKLALTVGALRRVVSALAASWRVEVVGADRLATLVRERQPVVLSFWHEQVLGLAPLLARRVLRAGLPVTLLSSRSRDGELGARLGAAWGAEIVRGSASRGGTEGLRGMYRSLRRGGRSPLVIPDGPRGPAYEAKPGTVVLAQMAGVPIQPLALRAPHAWRLKSWDRMLVPKPFSRVELHVGEPLGVSATLSEQQMDDYCEMLGRTLNRLSGLGE